MTIRRRLTGAALVLAAVALAGCSPAIGGAGQPVPPGDSVQWVSGNAEGNGAEPGTGDLAAAAGSSDRESTKWVQLSVREAGSLAPVVANGAGLTLYRFDKDGSSPSKSSCTGTCAETWPPVLVAPGGRIFLDGLDRSTVGLVQRPDGMLQVTIGGWPVYRYSKDKRDGDTNGQGSGGTWFGIGPDGKKAQDAKKQPGVAIVYDGKSLYGQAQGVYGPGCRDLPRPGTGASIRVLGVPIRIWSGRGCTGDSAGIEGNATDLSEIKFAGRVASIRFADPATQAGRGDSVIVYDDKNFDGDMQGTSGPGCQDLPRPGAGSSMRVKGGEVEVWSGADCTGDHTRVDGEASDLSAIGFDDRIASVKFGVSES
ncbi:hypothetical protein [Amycolatopsis pithecellobii]|uniref:Lipoprotein n=1 Tax=Amycolatopsis pithecellobii TaxID=664692 RepID=A0A6N7YS42_9PSEU|nr:hypothetical protein [Amycolatopsis pithecellobii]MTD55845.1 hypothetical protein [Amycolatopsis pithecellobii]